jgi:hypothetical protein
MALSTQEQFDLDSESPIYCDLIAEKFDDLMAAADLATEANAWQFNYFDDTEWDEWTELSIPMPIGAAVSRLTALTTDTQLLTILAEEPS